MTYIPIPSQRVGAQGDKDAPLVFIGEAPARNEVRTGRPFSGNAGSVFDFCLQGAQIIRAQCYITNVFKVPVSKRKTTRGEEMLIDGEVVFNGRGFTPAGQEHVSELHNELSECSSNILIPMGNPALCALTNRVGITERRGYITKATGDVLAGRKVLPTLHPATAIHGEYINRYIITRDFRKAQVQSEFPEIREPERVIEIPETFEQALAMLSSIRNSNYLAVDIETINHEVAIIGFADSPSHAISIPLYHKWTLEQETEIWRYIAEVLEDESISKVFQNGIFDIQFLFFRQRILTSGHIDDTMIAHSVWYPEFKKSLAFLASIYTDQPYWKDMPSFKHYKKES